MFFETILVLLYITAYIFLADLIMDKAWMLIKAGRPGKNPFLSVFYNALLFSLIIVALIAIIATKGKTIFIFSLPAFYIFYRSSKRDNKLLIEPTIPVVKKSSLWISIIGLSFITVLASYYFTLKFSMRNDISHYVKISECLIPQGIENPYHYYNKENDAFNGLMPYHYFEMWFGGILFQLNKILHLSWLSNFMFYIYVVYNLFRVIFFIGIFGLINKYVKFSSLFFLICVPIMLLDISAFCMWWNKSFIAESNFFERPNFIFYYVFLIALFDSVLNDDSRGLLTWSSVFILCSITVLPAIAGSAIVIMIFKFFYKKDNRKEIAKDTFIFFVFICLIFLFYKLFPISKEVKPIESFTLSEIIQRSLGIWKASIYMFLVLFIKIGVFILLAWLISKTKFIKALNISENIKRLTFFVILVNAVGIGLFQVVPYMDNMYQLAFIGYCATILLFTLLISLLVYGLSMYKRMILVASYLLVIGIGINSNLFNDHTVCQNNDWELSLNKNFLMQYGLSEKYVDGLKDRSASLADLHGASIIDGEDATKEFLGLRFSGIYQLGFYLMVYNNNVHLPLLSDPDKLYPDLDTFSKDYYKAKNFNALTRFYKNYNHQLDYKQNLNNYITENKISYFFASTNFKPELYVDPSKITSRLQDAKKGHLLITLVQPPRN